MSTLRRVLIADLFHIWRQAAAMSILLACGIAIYLMATSAMQSLEVSREKYYERYRFADIFCSLTRAPEEVRQQIQGLPGVRFAQTRIVRPVLLDLPEMMEPASCRLVSIDRHPEHSLNQLFLRQGRLPDPWGRNEVIASEPFAQAHQLEPGDLLAVNMDGRQEQLRVVGIGLSPEYVYAVQPGLLLSDDRRFGILWMPRRQMEVAFNMEGAFNDLTIAAVPRSSLASIISGVDRLLARYGGRGAYDRTDQDSHRRVSDEMHQMRSMAMVTPSIFLAVSAFLFHIVMTRLVQQQKDQIATLRAFGYRRQEIAVHYLQFIAIIVFVGACLGLLVGWRMSWWMVEQYAAFFRFPAISYQPSPHQAAFAISIGLSAALLGGFSAIYQAVQLQPAVAMRPDPPKAFGTSWLDRLGLGPAISPMMRMMLRRLEGSPLATGLSILGIAMGVAVLVLGSFMRDTIDFVIELQFGRSQRQDVMLTFKEALSPQAAHDVRHLPGVQRVEAFRSVAVRLKHGVHQHRLGLMGLSSSPFLYRVLDDRQQPIHFRSQAGLTVTRKLAEILDIRLGDLVEVEVLENKVKSCRVPVTGIFANFTDPAAYLNRQDLHRLMREGAQINGVFLSLDSRQQPRFYQAVKAAPAIAGVLDNNAARENFRRLITENTRIMRLVNAIFGAIIACGVIYNAALITLAESGRDLATLRVIGFSRWEVGRLLVGELAMLTFLAIPLGLPLGYAFSYLATLALDTESHRFPLIIHRHTMAYASLVICLAAAVSSILVRRMSDQLDLVAVLKAKVS
jgi:putative ABC transport system permease protein